MSCLPMRSDSQELEAVLQELTAKSAELSKQEQILAEKDFFIQSQAFLLSLDDWLLVKVVATLCFRVGNDLHANSDLAIEQ